MFLSAGNLRFAYGRPRGSASGGAPVIDDVSLQIGAGDMVGLLGPNGSGKTTLLRLLSGSLRPQGGHVLLDGGDLAAVSRRALARRVAVVPQETSLAFDYTVLEIVLMGRYPHLGTFEVEGPADLAAAMAALESTGTASLADRQFRTLSGGEKQRVVIASALAQLDVQAAPRPGSGGVRLLVLDEPTASLDLRYQFEVAALLHRIHDERGITILLSTHDLRFAAAVCARLVLLSGGRILADGRPPDVLTPALVGRLFGVDPALTTPILAAAAASR